jgi:hypothetical protein
MARVRWDEHHEGGRTTDLVPVADLELETKMVSTLSAKTVTFQMPCSTSSRAIVGPSAENSMDADIEAVGHVGGNFTDAALGECLISGFGTEGGEHILCYSPSQGGGWSGVPCRTFASVYWVIWNRQWIPHEELDEGHVARFSTGRCSDGDGFDVTSSLERIHHRCPLAATTDVIDFNSTLIRRVLRSTPMWMSHPQT